MDGPYPQAVVDKKTEYVLLKKRSESLKTCKLLHIWSKNQTKTLCVQDETPHEENCYKRQGLEYEIYEIHLPFRRDFWGRWSLVVARVQLAYRTLQNQNVIAFKTAIMLRWKIKTFSEYLHHENQSMNFENLSLFTMDKAFFFVVFQSD